MIGESVKNCTLMLAFVCAATVAVGCRPGEVISPPDMKAPVRVGEVTLDTVQSVIQSTGTLRASEQVVLRTESEGQFLLGEGAEGERLREGHEVAAGQIIARLENPGLVANMALEARRQEAVDAEKRLKRALPQLAEGILSENEVEPLRAKASHARYAVDAAEAQLEKLTIASPIAGRVVRLSEIVDGDHVPAGTEVATIMSYRRILADVSIANPDYARVEVGQEALVRSFALKDAEFTGRVAHISPVADEHTRAFQADITVDNPDEALRPGMYIQADIIVSRRDGAVVVPPELVLTRNGKQVVFVVEEEKAMAREVETGIETREQVEIISGIDSGDVLILEGFETLRDGTPVTVSK